MGFPKELKLKRHETFSIREGWLEKAINYIAKEPSCFSKDNGTRMLGIGSAMVKSLRYWVQATKLIEFKKDGGYLTEFGKVIFHYDKYLEEEFSWWFIHVILVNNYNDAPVLNRIFNLKSTKFDKSYLRAMIEEEFQKQNLEIKSMASLESDINVFLKSYYEEDEFTPENNLACPLSRLNLLIFNDKKEYVKNTPSYKSLDYRIVYFALVKCVESDISEENSIKFNLEDILKKEDNPIQLLNLSQSLLFMYLDEMQKNKLIKMDKTAGLNVVYIDNVLSIEELFRLKYGEGETNV